MLPSQLIMFFKPHAFAYRGCGNPLSQEVFAATKFPLSSLRHIYIPYRRDCRIDVTLQSPRFWNLSSIQTWSWVIFQCFELISSVRTCFQSSHDSCVNFTATHGGISTSIQSFLFHLLQMHHRVITNMQILVLDMSPINIFGEDKYKYFFC